MEAVALVDTQEEVRRGKGQKTLGTQKAMRRERTSFDFQAIKVGNTLGDLEDEPLSDMLTYTLSKAIAKIVEKTLGKKKEALV